MATIQIPTTPAGYQQLLAWAHERGEPIVWGVEGTGCYGAALARFPARPWDGRGARASLVS